MPFSKTSDSHTEEYWRNHYETFLKQEIELKHKLKAIRSSPLRGDIVRQIITDLVTGEVVIADVTDSNANVYWELGIRQSFKHGTITIAEQGTQLPFDLSGKGTLFYYPNNHLRMQEFIQKFHEAIEDCLKNPDLPDSHVLETISGRGTLHQIISRAESIRKLDAVIDEIDFNVSQVKYALERAGENIAKRNATIKEDKSTVGIEYPRPTVGTRCIALEKLSVDRYIDAPSSFYLEISRCMMWITSFNGQLPLWSSEAEGVEKWMVKICPSAIERLNGIKKLARKHKAELELNY